VNASASRSTGCCSRAWRRPRTCSLVIRLGTERLLQEMLEREATAYLGRERYQRRDPAQPSRGYRNGYGPGCLRTTEGEIRVEVPSARGVRAIPLGADDGAAGPPLHVGASGRAGSLLCPHPGSGGDDRCRRAAKVPKAPSLRQSPSRRTGGPVWPTCAVPRSIPSVFAPPA